MNDERIFINRRRLLFGALATIAALPFLRNVVVSPAQAELPHLSEDDAAAKALNYKHDATSANRIDKSGVSAKDQLCHNCNFIKNDEGGWRPCQLFPGKLVNANGWCSSWTKQTS